MTLKTIIYKGRLQLIIYPSIRIKLNNVDLTSDNEIMQFSKVNEDF